MKATLIKKHCFTDNLAEFVFQLSEKKTWQTGQFAMLTISDAQHPVVKRAYSIASAASSSPELSFMIKRVENGRATTWLFDKLEEKDSCELDLAYGHLVVDPNDHNELLLIATGIGIAPILAFVRENENWGFKKKVRLVFGVRHEDELCHLSYLQELNDQYDNFEFYYIVSQPIDEKYQGERGRCDQILPKLNLDPKKQTVLMCGSPLVTKSLKNNLLDLGYLEKQIKLESF